MLTLDFSTVISGVAQLAGLDRDNLPAHFFKQVRDLANRRLAIAWISAPWPDLVRVESVAVTSTANQFNLTDSMGEIIEVYEKDPLVTAEAVPVTYRLYDNGGASNARKIITRGGQSTIYVEYRIARSDLTGNAWKAGTYANGSQAYKDGYFYNSTASTTQTPPNTQWEKVEIPSRFSGYLMQGIYSDYLKSNGTKDEAEDVKSEEILSLEIDSLIREQGQVRKTNVSTY
tara:strand:- start:632 stop:1321 length:690 start_codon:yes stop_codon:yes gene_type:complete